MITATEARQNVSNYEAEKYKAIYTGDIYNKIEEASKNGKRSCVIYWKTLKKSDIDNIISSLNYYGYSCEHTGAEYDSFGKYGMYRIIISW